ncbi:hypothetical protein SDC9_121929 [bioreactor metagenome]|uniref:Uncharacterized protein n=1 Tax=bioreactor metagenome TaxID=1076179 RepID=A0A645CDE2_9ZZZZ
MAAQAVTDIRHEIFDGHDFTVLFAGQQLGAGGKFSEIIRRRRIVIAGNQFIMPAAQEKILEARHLLQYRVNHLFAMSLRAAIETPAHQSHGAASDRRKTQIPLFGQGRNCPVARQFVKYRRHIDRRTTIDPRRGYRPGGVE